VPVSAVDTARKLLNHHGKRAMTGTYPSLCRTPAHGGSLSACTERGSINYADHFEWNRTGSRSIWRGSRVFSRLSLSRIA
jgi:hypothetical protein